MPVKCEVDATWTHDFTKVTLPLELDMLHWGTPVLVSNVKGWVVSNADQVITVQFPEAHPVHPERVMVEQILCVSDPNSIADHLSKFWGPLWNSEQMPTEF